MKREDFMRELEYLLRDIPESDRVDAVAYYNDYFDEAGVENEERVIQELGSPEKVAKTIKEDLGKMGYEEPRGHEEPRGYEEPSEKKKAPWLWIIIIAVLAVLVWFGIVGGLFNGFRTVLNDGKFSIHFDDGGSISLSLFGDEIFDWNEEGETGNIDVNENCSKLNVEFGAGTLKICYGDVDKIHIDYEHVVGFESSVKNDTLNIEGGIGVSDNSNASLTITIPQDMSFEKVTLEIGASQAEITDLKATKLDVEVGVGEAIIRNLDVEQLDAETGVGQLTIEVIGTEEDYNYSLECGVGSIKIADSSYGGIGSSHTVNNPGADRNMDIECGVGEIEIDFTE